MFYSFLIVWALSGAPLTAVKSHESFASLEACESWQRPATQSMTDRLEAGGVPFRSVNARCALDEGQSPESMFGLTKDQTPISKGI
jgi:hypothetical protein